MEMFSPRYGLKFWEFQANEPWVWGYLLRKSNESGGGDIATPTDRPATDGGTEYHWPNQGRWAGDRVALVGDYDETGWYDEEQYTNITAILELELKRLEDWLS